MKKYFSDNFRKLTYAIMMLIQLINVVLTAYGLTDAYMFILIMLGAEGIKTSVFASTEDFINTLNYLIEAKDTKIDVLEEINKQLSDSVSRTNQTI